MKRPWTPGPWTLGGTNKARKIGKLLSDNEVAFVSNWFVGSIPDNQMDATVRLASKAPEMAELLIIIVKGSTCVDIDTFHDLLLDAVRLLQEIGYEPEMDGNFDREGNRLSC